MPLTPKQEIALALVLWKSYRQNRHCPKSGQSKNNNDNYYAAMRSLEMASKLGVKDEFLEIVFAHPVMKLECKELDKWETSELSKNLCVEIIPNTKKPKKSFTKNRKDYAGVKRKKPTQNPPKKSSNSSPKPSNKKSTKE